MIGFRGKINSSRRLAGGTGICSAAAVLMLLVSTAWALDGRPRNVRTQDQTLQDQSVEQSAQGTQEAQAQLPPRDTTGNSPAPPPPSGPLERMGRWIDDSVSSASAGISAAWQGTIGGFSGIGGQAGDAAKGAADAAGNVAKGAADVAKGAANVATTAAKETAGVVTRLPASRIAAGRERCTTAPNGAPDCRAAADALCKGKGFGSGTSVDFENVENCPAEVLLAGRRSERDCPVDYFVTRSLCQ
jgi:hypothetical protein